MPLGKGVRYRVKTTASGKKVRLAFKGGSVIEAKNLETGDTSMISPKPRKAANPLRKKYSWIKRSGD